MMYACVYMMYACVYMMWLDTVQISDYPLKLIFSDCYGCHGEAGGPTWVTPSSHRVLYQRREPTVKEGGKTDEVIRKRTRTSSWIKISKQVNSHFIGRSHTHTTQNHKQCNVQ